MAGARRIVAKDSANAALMAVMAPMLDDPRADAAARAEALDRLAMMIEPYTAAVAGEAVDFSFLHPDACQWLPLAGEQQASRLRFIQLQLAGESGAIDQLSDTRALSPSWRLRYL